MNMVGYKGKGVSGWLSVATAYALTLWADVCDGKDPAFAVKYRAAAESINKAVNKHLWDGDWFARGITDDGVVFGRSEDSHGKIFLNAQSWAILSGAAAAEQIPRMLSAVERHLYTPYGPCMLAPAYAEMRDDVGRVTQKFPGSAENGSVYNHAVVFYIFSLFQIREADRAYALMRQMLPGPTESNYVQRGQLPVFIPNYYRGAYHEYPRTAGRSSQLFNTGTVAWFYRCLVEGLFGVSGTREGLLLRPQLPKEWNSAKVFRRFRSAEFEINIVRGDVEQQQVWVDGQLSSSHVVKPVAGRRYQVVVTLPRVSGLAG